MKDEHIVVTGIGLVTPLGGDRSSTWKNICEGREYSSSSSHPFTTSSPISNLNGKHRIFSIASLAVKKALFDARVDMGSIDLDRVGCSVSVSKPVLQFPLPPLPPESINRHIRRSLGICGPSGNYIAACATGLFSLLTARYWLKENMCDIAIAGSVESSLDPLYVSGFKNMGVLSETPRPFDRRRDGFIIGEGGGVLILEKRVDAMARGAHIYAEILGGAVGSDSAHPTSFSLDGSSIASVLKRALERSGVSRGDVNYVHCHGTGTKLNDLLETRAIKTIFGKGAYNLSLSSTKAATGHLLGASGSVQAALTALSVQENFAPPTLHLEEADPECDLDYTPLRGKDMRVNVAVSLSFGFGGPMGSLVLGKGL